MGNSLHKRCCQHCTNPITKLRSGPQPTYCSQRCRTAAHRAHSVPTPMRMQARWIGWQSMGERPPMPHYARNNWLGVSLTNDPQSPWGWENWAYAQTMRNDQRGYVLGDGIGCVTVLECVDAKGKVTPAVRAALPATYTEFTWDGRGVQALGWLSPVESHRITVAGYAALVAAKPPAWVPLTGKRIGSTTTLADLSALSGG